MTGGMTSIEVGKGGGIFKDKVVIVSVAQGHYSLCPDKTFHFWMLVMLMRAKGVGTGVDTANMLGPN